jgi:3-deoxy-manno-octulosonate cytidylyltransferase (CMP-KDO synthetase)
MKILGIIPARYASTRFPAKALVNIAGKTMVQRVYEQARKSKFLSEVVVATDHSEIYNHVVGFGGKVVMTKAEHPSGTDRCFEAYQNLGQQFDFIINIQGDEPFIDPLQIDQIAEKLKGDVELASLCKYISDSEELFSPNNVKVIRDIQGKAIYFSRHPVPYLRNHEQQQWLKHHKYFKHIGIYAYRTDILEKVTKLSTSILEKAESLEQLRWLENGYSILMVETNYDSIGIDVPEDLKKIDRFLN